MTKQDVSPTAPTTHAPSLDAHALLGHTREQFADPYFRLNRLYTIVTEEAQVIPFRMNFSQRALYQRWWFLNIILKARKQGFTTLIALMALDQCIFLKNFTAGIIAHSLPDAETIFRKRVKFPWEQLPQAIKDANPLVKETGSELVWANGSSISVGTSFRGDTPQFLHVSEYGKISRRFPDKAREIKSGALESVAAGQMICIESTAEGNGGEYHDLVSEAQQVRASGRDLTEVDFRLHFFPWFHKRSNTVNNPGVVPISSELRKYFARVEKEMGVTLTPGQKAWYAVKIRRLGEDLMRQEHPSTEAEPFQVAVEGSIFAKQMAWLRRHGRIARFPIVPGIPVNTFWDWGINDAAFFWCHQRVNGLDRFSYCYENHNEAVEHYAEIMRDTGFTIWGDHYVPHDFEQRRPGLTVNKTLGTLFAEAQIKPQVLVPRIDDKRVAIAEARRVLPHCAFDIEDCERGIECLDNHSFEWDERQGVWRDYPRKDEYKHGCDAYETFAVKFDDLRRLGFTQQPKQEKKKRVLGSKPVVRERSWRTR